MTNKEAEKLLLQLEEHYKEPVMPIGRYCKALETWKDLVYKHGYGEEEKTHWGDRKWTLNDCIYETYLAIHKSNLLWRMLYSGLEPRNEKCPVHKGHWSGCVWKELECGCGYGANVTGWLPNE